MKKYGKFLALIIICLFIFTGVAKAQHPIYGDLRVYATTQVDSTLKVYDGTVASPAYTFTDDTDVGFYRIGADNIGLSLGGSKTVDFLTTGVTVTDSLKAAYLQTGAGSLSNPGLSFTVDANTGFYRIGEGNIGLSLDGVKEVDFLSTGLTVTDSLKAEFMQSGSGTATNPAYSFKTDGNTGIYRSAENTLSIAASGAQKYSFSDTEFNLLSQDLTWSNGATIDNDQSDTLFLTESIFKFTGDIGINGAATSALDVYVTSEAARIYGTPSTTQGLFHIRSAQNYETYLSFAEDNVSDRGGIGFEPAGDTMRFIVGGDISTGDTKFGVSGSELLAWDDFKFIDPGTSADSYKLVMEADNTGTTQTGEIFVAYGANPYIRLSAPNASGTATPTMDIRSDLISFFNGAADTDYYFSFNGEDNDGTITYMEDEDRFDFDNNVLITNDLTARNLTVYKSYTNNSEGRDPVIQSLLGSAAYLNVSDLISKNGEGFIAYEGINIEDGTPNLTLTDTDTGADNIIDADNAAGSLMLKADDNAEVASSQIEFYIDGSQIAYFRDDSDLMLDGDIYIEQTSPGITFIDTNTGTDCKIDGNSSAGSLIIRADINSEAADSNIEFYIDGSTRSKIDGSGNIQADGNLDIDGTSTNDVYGGFEFSVTTVNTATYDLVAGDYILHVTYPTAGAVTSLTLPSAQTIIGRTIIIKDASGNANTNNITIDTEGAETIDGAATYVMNIDYESITLYSDGSDWYII